MNEETDPETTEFFLKLLKERRPDMQPEIMEALASIGTKELKQKFDAELLSEENKK